MQYDKTERVIKVHSAHIVEKRRKSGNFTKKCRFRAKKRALLLRGSEYNRIQYKGRKYHFVCDLKGRQNDMERKIKLTPDMVEHFVAVASKCDFDIDIAYNRYVVDAKSFLGVYGLDFSQILTVRYNGFDAAFEELLKTCAIAC